MVMTRLLFFCYAVIIAAQTPPGFTPAVTQTLEVAYGEKLINPAGKNVPRPGNYIISVNQYKRTYD